jgi:hypothetical protein
MRGDPRRRCAGSTYDPPVRRAASIFPPARRRALRLAAGLVSALLAAVGCGPSEECRRYVECQRAYDPDVSTAPYEDGGPCWSGLQTAQACTAQCTAALEAFAEISDAPAVCRGS